MVDSVKILNAGILIVDDQEANVSLLEKMLRGAGYGSISSTMDPYKVCELYSKNRYDLILLDLQMPGMDGFQVMEGLKKIETNDYLPVLVITAQPGHKLRALKAGAKDFVSKPFDLAEVLMRVYNMLEVRLLHMEAKKLYDQIVAEQKVSEQLLLIFRSGPVAISISTILEGRIIDANEEYCRFFGYSREEMVGRNVVDLNLWANPGERGIVIERLLKEGTIHGYETKKRRRSGAVSDVLASFELIELAGQSEPVLINIFTDITERNETQLKLREGEENYRDLLENANDLIVSVAPDGRLFYANRAWHDALGYGSEDLTKIELLELVHPEHREHYAKLFNEAAKGNNVPLIETDFVAKGDKRIAVEGSVSAKSVQGKIVSLLFIFRDVTLKKKSEAQLLRNQRMESIGTLAGGIAHDLNNVLTPILMAIQLLRRKLTDEGSLKILNILESSAQHGADMVKQVLTFSRGVEGKRTPVPIKQLVTEIQTIIQHTFPKSIRFHMEIPADVWTIIGDVTQLHQALLNLCVNARDAMPTGGTLTVKVENIVLDEYFASMYAEAKSGNYVVLNVTDTGSGIPPQVRERIFDPFFTTKALDKGTGLGLSTVRGIVKSHNGFINVYSEMGKGSNFKLYLPATASSSASQTQTQLMDLPMGMGELILVVDDEAAILSITQQSLEMFGYEVLTATDGAQAIALCALNRGKIKLLLTDMMMPIMDGAATIRAARTIDPELKIIAASGLGPEAGTTDPEQLGANAFLHKPYTAERLLKIVAEVLAPEHVAAK